MSTTWFLYEDMAFEVERPESIKFEDEHIGNRCHELLKGVVFQDEWTHRIDQLILEHNITYKKITMEEMLEKTKKATNITYRM